MNENPIACSLGANELASRLAEIESIGAESLLSRQLEGDARVLRFEAGAHARERLEAIVVAESECCPYLGLELRQEAEQLVLAIRAPAGAAPVAAELAAAFARRRPELGQ